jgi:hypothetical protein
VLGCADGTARGTCQQVEGVHTTSRARGRAPTLRRDVFAIALALLIGYTSVLSAVVAWRASLSSIEAAGYGSLALQQQARREQLERQLEGIVGQDLRLVVVYREHALAARELQAQADEVRTDNPELADDLDLEAHGRLALARSVQPFLLGQAGVFLNADGSVGYDAVRVLRLLQEGELELREVRPAETQALAAAAGRHTLLLIALAAVLVAALLFLTVAQVVRRGVNVRYGFTLGGALLAGLGTIALVGVELVGR